jgi:hypothetical protein
VLSSSRGSLLRRPDSRADSEQVRVGGVEPILSPRSRAPCFSAPRREKPERVSLSFTYVLIHSITMTVRATRSQSKPAAAPIKSKKPTTRKTNPKAKVATQPTTNSRKRKAAEAASHDHSDSDIDPEADSDGDDPDNDDDNHKPSSSESESEADEGLESDALDEDTPPPPPKRRKRASPVKASSTSKISKTTSPLKKRKTKSKDSDDEDDVYEDDLEEGQEVVGRVVQAPKTGHVPPGQISQNTMDFLSKLADPKYNDRTWYVCYC